MENIKYLAPHTEDCKCVGNVRETAGGPAILLWQCTPDCPAKANGARQAGDYEE